MTECKKYDLEERTEKFGETVIDLRKTIKQSAITAPIINQLIRSTTSVGANYMEVNGASSKKDFKNKIHVCKKEAQETKHWLRMLVRCAPEKDGEIRVLWKETQELSMIFGKIVGTMNNKQEETN